MMPQELFVRSDRSLGSEGADMSSCMSDEDMGGTSQHLVAVRVQPNGRLTTKSDIASV